MLFRATKAVSATASCLPADCGAEQTASLSLGLTEAQTRHVMTESLPFSLTQAILMCSGLSPVNLVQTVVMGRA